jgi:hypothetical protein
LDAILAHELRHWRRRDNLTTAAQLLVEAMFRFHRWSGFAIGPTALAQVRQRMAASSPLPGGRQMSDVEMKHYQNKEWNFGIDVRALECISRRTDQQPQRGHPLRVARGWRPPPDRLSSPPIPR